QRITGQFVAFFAVSEYDEGTISHGAFAEALRGERNGARDGGAAFGNAFCVEIVDCFDHGVVVNRKRGLQKSAPGKGDQTNAVALQFVNQILDREFDALESIRLDVVGEHAPRRIHGDEQIQPFTLYVLKRVTPSR